MTDARPRPPDPRPLWLDAAFAQAIAEDIRRTVERGPEDAAALLAALREAEIRIRLHARAG